MRAPAGFATLRAGKCPTRPPAILPSCFDTNRAPASGALPGFRYVGAAVAFGTVVFEEESCEMKRFVAAAVAAGVITASCSGHAGSALPGVPSTGGAPSTMGMHGTRGMSTVVNLPAGFAATATQAVSLTGVSDNGPLAATKTLTIHVALQLRNVDQLQRSVAAGQITPRATFMSTYAPTADQVSQVTSYLQSQGFTNVRAEANNILVDATGSVASIEKAF